MNRMDRNSFKNLVEDVNKVVTSKEELGSDFFKKCISSINEHFVNEGIHLSEDELKEFWAGAMASAKHLMGGKLAGMSDVYHTAEQDAATKKIEGHAQKRFNKAQKRVQKRADFLYNTGDAVAGDREHEELHAAAMRRLSDLSHAAKSNRTATAPRLGGEARKEGAKAKANLATSTANLSSSRADVARLTGERDRAVNQAETQRRVDKVKRRGIRIGAANKGDAKQQKHLAGVVTRSGKDPAKYKVKGVHQKTGKYVLGGSGVPDVMVDHVMNFVRNVING